MSDSGEKILTNNYSLCSAFLGTFPFLHIIIQGWLWSWPGDCLGRVSALFYHGRYTQRYYFFLNSICEDTFTWCEDVIQDGRYTQIYCFLFNSTCVHIINTWCEDEDIRFQGTAASSSFSLPGKRISELWKLVSFSAHLTIFFLKYFFKLFVIFSSCNDFSFS